jgi:hypothetical protein
MAAGDIFFTAINNTVLPMSSKTMPRYFGDTLYIPYTFFSSDELGVYFAPGSDQIMLYSYTSGYKSLTFDTVKSTVFDQDNTQRYFEAIKSGGLVYVPVYDICRFFGLTLNVYTADPAPVVRISHAADSSDILNRPTFFSMNSARIRTYYDDYIGVQVSPGASPTASASPSEEPTFESVSIYLSFYDLKPDQFSAVLAAFDTHHFKSCFFVSADEIRDDADLLRRAVGKGHTLGIWLKDGTFDEYETASSLLFEAAKTKTILVSASGSAAKTAKETAALKGLVFWRPTRTYDETAKLSYSGFTGKLTVLNGSRESVNIACADKAAPLVGSILFYLADKHYSVRRITEKTPPTITI